MRLTVLGECAPDVWRASGRWSGSGRKETGRSAGRFEADTERVDDTAAGLREADRNPGCAARRRQNARHVAGADAVAGLAVAMRRGLALAVMPARSRRLGRTGVEPLHRGPGDSGSRQDQCQGQ
jgi:hypothetical protein